MLDDGSIEGHVSDPRLRAARARNAAKPTPKKKKPKWVPRWKVGDRVEINLGGEWWPGTISRVDWDRECYDVTLDDDGSRRPGISDGALRAGRPAGPRYKAKFKPGDRVQGKYGGKGKWKTARVTRVVRLGPDGSTTYDVQFDDGRRDACLAEPHLRWPVKNFLRDT